jgi:cell wall-associated NlpC family hydrolase
MDRRIHPFRPGLAAQYLRGRVKAAHYAPGVERTVLRGATALRRDPAPGAPLESELLFGESVTVYDQCDGWAWLQNATDGYVGYARSEALGPRAAPATHWLCTLRSYVYDEPDLKSPTRDLLSLCASLRVTAQNGTFSELSGGGWIHSGHILPVGEFASDPVAVALRFLGTAYLWGGRTSIGLDCSALIQLALARCGQAVPRDTDLQAAQIGSAVDFDGDEAVLQRGDLVYWPGHAGLWIDADRFLHANATDMMVSIAPLATVAAHIKAAQGDAITIIRRPSPGFGTV